jgi:hypothetical protein
MAIDLAWCRKRSSWFFRVEIVISGYSNLDNADYWRRPFFNQVVLTECRYQNLGPRFIWEE